jgi:hypothetical protein
VLFTQRRKFRASYTVVCIRGRPVDACLPSLNFPRLGGFAQHFISSSMQIISFAKNRVSTRRLDPSEFVEVRPW